MKKNHIHLSNWEAFVLNLTVSLVTISTYQLLETVFGKKNHN
jgi:hypothetical protein